jgi:hypothetical protein
VRHGRCGRGEGHRAGVRRHRERGPELPCPALSIPPPPPPRVFAEDWEAIPDVGAISRRPHHPASPAPNTSLTLAITSQPIICHFTLGPAGRHADSTPALFACHPACTHLPPMPRYLLRSGRASLTMVTAHKEASAFRCLCIHTRLPACCPLL